MRPGCHALKRPAHLSATKLRIRSPTALSYQACPTCGIAHQERIAVLSGDVERYHALHDASQPASAAFSAHVKEKPIGRSHAPRRALTPLGRDALRIISKRETRTVAWSRPRHVLSAQQQSSVQTRCASSYAVALEPSATQSSSETNERSTVAGSESGDPFIPESRAVDLDDVSISIVHAKNVMVSQQGPQGVEPEPEQNLPIQKYWAPANVRKIEHPPQEVRLVYFPSPTTFTLSRAHHISNRGSEGAQGITTCGTVLLPRNYRVSEGAEDVPTSDSEVLEGSQAYRLRRARSWRKFNVELYRKVATEAQSMSVEGDGHWTQKLRLLIKHTEWPAVKQPPQTDNNAAIPVIGETNQERSSSRSNEDFKVERDEHGCPIPPGLWTPASLKAFVLASVARAQDRTLVHGRYRMWLVDELSRLLQGSPELLHCLDREVFHIVIRHFLRMSLHRRAESILGTMLSSQRYSNDCHPTTATYNLFLEAHAKAEHGAMFWRVCRHMIDAGLKPDGKTWSAFLVLSRTVEQKRAILRELYARGLMHDMNKTSVVRAIVSWSFRDHVGSKQTLAPFLQGLDWLFDSDWISHASVHAMLDILAEADDLAGAFSLLESLRSHHAYIVTAMDMGVLLAHCEKQQRPDTAVSIVRHFARVWHVRLDAAIFDILHRLFWQSKYLNCAKAVWKFACMRRKRTWNMVARIVGGLDEYVREQVAQSADLAAYDSETVDPAFLDCREDDLDAACLSDLLPSEFVILHQVEGDVSADDDVIDLGISMHAEDSISHLEDLLMTSRADMKNPEDSFHDSSMHIVNGWLGISVKLRMAMAVVCCDEIPTRRGPKTRQQIIRQQLAVEDRRPLQHFASTLHEAVELDESWIQTGHRARMDIAWMLERSIYISADLYVHNGNHINVTSSFRSGVVEIAPHRALASDSDANRERLLTGTSLYISHRRINNFMRTIARVLSPLTSSSHWNRAQLISLPSVCSRSGRTQICGTRFVSCQQRRRASDWPYLYSPKADMTPQLKPYYKQVDDLAESFIERLRKAVAIPSVSSEDERRPEVVRMGNFLADELKALGASVELRALGKQPHKENLDLPPVIVARYGSDKAKRTILVYGHYDVQPASKEDGWATEPFKLTIDDKGRMFGRGSTDDKGPVLGWLNAIEAHQKAGIEFPVNLLMCFEGMEEYGSEGLDDFIAQEADKYFKDADAVCISDNYWLGTEKPCLTYGLRGCNYYSVEISGPGQDLHSGVFGGTAQEPMTDLVQVMGSLVTRDGKILIPGINELVAPVTKEEEALYTDIAFTMDNLYESLGSQTSIYPDKKSTLMARWRYPSLSLHGIEGAFYAPGAKTVIPAKVTGKFSIRIVPDMEIDDVNKLVEKHVMSEFKKLGSKNSCRVWCQHSGKWWVASPNHWNFTAAGKAVEDVWGVKPDLTREGGSIPVTLTFEEKLGKNVLLLPMGSSTDGAHSINEKLDRKNYIEGIKLLGAYLHYVAAEPKAGGK
ncbi:hypothetical protein MRB53_040607 [Persea americana]|nr:hypothetical protein MRB53_040607 [Persea americana]